MPTFTTDGDRQFVSIVTGPSHVRLGLRFAALPVENPAIVRQPPVGGCSHAPLDESKIVAVVIEGVAAVDQSLSVSEIVYVTDDSPRYSLYSRCAQLLAQRHISK